MWWQFRSIFMVRLRCKILTVEHLMEKPMGQWEDSESIQETWVAALSLQDFRQIAFSLPLFTSSLKWGQMRSLQVQLALIFHIFKQQNYFSCCEILCVKHRAYGDEKSPGASLCLSSERRAISPPHAFPSCGFGWAGGASPMTLFLFVSGAISSRMPMNSCATFWITCTWNSRAVSMVFPAHQFCRRILPCLQVTNVACKILFPLLFQGNLRYFCWCYCSLDL